MSLLRGSRGLGESYTAGLWDTPDLTAVIRVAARNVDGIDRIRRRLTVVRAPYQLLRAAFVRNTPTRSRKDIAAHYDLGNELFSRMLDPTLMYSCAVFKDGDATLEQASIAKLEMVCDKLELGPADHVLEIGAGWGGFAVHAALTRGCRVSTTTISKEQYDTALARVRAAGVEGRVEVLLDDYRDLRGSYDKLVSIEMIEAVGWKDFGTFFQCCSDLLAPDGVMLLQAITMNDDAYEVEKASKSFIRTYVFPHGCLPSRQVIAKCVARRTDFATEHLEDLTRTTPRRCGAGGRTFRRPPRSWSRLDTTSAFAGSGGCTCPTGGRLRRAQDRPDPGSAGKAAMGRPSPTDAGDGSTTPAVTSAVAG